MGKLFHLENSPTGVQHYVDVDEDGFTYVEHTPTLVDDAIIDECSKLRALHQNKASNFHFAGKIPINLHTAWKKEWRETARDKMTWPTFLAIKMNNRDFSKLNVGGKLPTAKRRHL